VVERRDIGLHALYGEQEVARVFEQRLPDHGGLNAAPSAHEQRGL